MCSSIRDPFEYVQNNILDPSLGCANVDQQIVDLATASLIQLSAPHYASLRSSIRRVKSPIDCLPFSYYVAECFINKMPDYLIEIGCRNAAEVESEEPRYKVAEVESEEPRYKVAGLRYRVCHLDETTPMGTLITALRKRLAELGFFCDKFVDVRLERGCIIPGVSSWHLDRAVEGKAITLCYSDVPDWSTRIFGDANTGYAINLPNGREKVEALRQASKLGHFYDALSVLHRSPTENDFPGGIPADKYRLFMRFA